MGFQSSRFLYSRDPARRRLQLANEAAARAAKPDENKTTALPETFKAAPVKNAELAANPICRRNPQP